MNKLPIDTSIEVSPQNPFTVDIPTQDLPKTVAYPGFEETPGFLETAGAEFKELSSVYHLFHAANAPMKEPAGLFSQSIYPQINDKFYHPAPDGWSPKQEMEKIPNLDPRFIPKLMMTKSPVDFQYQLESVQEETQRTLTLENGSTFAKVMGGLVGLTLGSIENFIPLTAAASKAKVGAGFLSGMSTVAPGVVTAAAIREGAIEMDKVDGTVSEFLKNTFIDAAFGMVFFGVIGAGKSLVNLSEFNRLKQFSRDYLDGIGINQKIDKEGNLIGFEAVDTTGNVSAALVTRAQEHADAAFYKGGVFKIPYVGDATLALVSGNIPGFKYVFGSPLIQFLSSKYKSARAFANAGFDHSITTEGEMKGGTRPLSFEFKVKKMRAVLTGLKVETDALHAERNGYKITGRPAIAIQNAWSAVKQKSIETLSKESNSTDWVSKDTFMDEIQRVLFSKTSSEHGSVNEAAAIYRKVIDEHWTDYRKAYNLPDTWMPSRTAEGYLMRVYDTAFLNENEGLWTKVVSKWIKDSDELITQKMQPIHDLDRQIKEYEVAHTKAFEELGIRELQLHPSREITYPEEQGVSIRNYIEPTKKGSKKRKTFSRETKLIPYEDIRETYNNMREQLKALQDNLQNELRTNPEYNIHVDDVTAMSADEAKELKGILKPSTDLKKQIEEQKAVVSQLKAERSRKLTSAKKSETVESAKPKAAQYAEKDEAVDAAEQQLRQLEGHLYDEEQRLFESAKNGEINPHLYNTQTFEFKNPSNRLKFREVHASDFHREAAAKGYYNSIMNMHPEDIIADVFGRATGNKDANALKKRTLMIPDEILYNNNFLTKDLYAKTANYVNFLGRRTHLKTSFEHVTVNGDFEELAGNLLTEHQSNRELINKRLDKLTASLEGKSAGEKEKIQKEIQKEKKKINKESKDFNEIKAAMKHLYENRMMGINKRSDLDNGFRRTWMSLAAATNLHNLPATQITDLAFGGYQHGIWPYVRDGIYPIIESLGGILKTKDALALREMAPHLNLGYQDVLNNYADKNWHSELQPYLNMGKVMSGIEKYAHFSALTDLSPYIDNGLQRAHGSVIQSRFMELLHKQVDGTLSKKESLYLRKYGIDPKIWADKMVASYKNSSGFKTKLGGYMSKSWEWQDMEAANVFNDAVFRGIQNTLVWKGMADSPFLADNILGMFFHTFTGWGYAATNRYLIPSLQHPDGELLIKMMFMMGAGALVSPLRRISRGEEPWPDDMKPEQIAYEAWSDSGTMSNISNVLNIANFFSQDKLLGDLKNDKFKNRMRTGIFGTSDVISSTATRMSDILGMANSGLNEKDLKTAAKMLPISGAMYGHYFSDKLIEGMNLPRNKRAAGLQ